MSVSRRISSSILSAAPLYDPPLGTVHVLDMYRDTSLHGNRLSDQAVGILWFGLKECILTQTEVCAFYTVFMPHYISRQGRTHEGNPLIAPDGKVYVIRCEAMNGGDSSLPVSPLNGHTILLHPGYDAWISTLLFRSGNRLNSLYHIGIMNRTIRRPAVAAPAPSAAAAPAPSAVAAPAPLAVAVPTFTAVNAPAAGSAAGPATPYQSPRAPSWSPITPRGSPTSGSADDKMVTSAEIASRHATPEGEGGYEDGEIEGHDEGSDVEDGDEEGSGEEGGGVGEDNDEEGSDDDDEGEGEEEDDDENGEGEDGGESGEEEDGGEDGSEEDDDEEDGSEDGGEDGEEDSGDDDNDDDDEDDDDSN